MKKMQTKTAKETEEAGFLFSQTLKLGAIVALHGNLGSGKTTFVQGVARGLGLSSRILSPTFVIIRSYEKKEGSIKKLYHIDLYRSQDKSSFEILGLNEIISDASGVVFIEWPESIESLLPKRSHHLYFSHLDEEKREIAGL